MIPLEEAQQRLLDIAPPLGTRSVPLLDAAGCYLAKDMTARRTQPAKDLSAMDGYAFAHAGFLGPWRVVGESAAGGSFDGAVQAGEAVRIFTGAPLPAGTDTVLIQEEARRDGDALSVIGDITLPKGRHVRIAGSDFGGGETLVAAGTLLNAAQIGLAAMAGHDALCVYHKPRIAIFSTGDELVPPGEIVGENQMPASNDIMLAAMMKMLPCKIASRAIIPDELEATKDALRNASADIIVTIGGASVGDHDLVRPALEAVGANIDFWKVAMRPGKPVMAGMLGEAAILGLPGNPASAYVTAFLFLQPLIRHMAGAPEPRPKAIGAKLDGTLPANGERSNFVRAQLSGGQVTPLPSTDSAVLATLARANALIHRPALATEINAGEEVPCYRLDPIAS